MLMSIMECDELNKKKKRCRTEVLAILCMVFFVHFFMTAILNLPSRKLVLMDLRSCVWIGMSGVDVRADVFIKIMLNI